MQYIYEFSKILYYLFSFFLLLLYRFYNVLIVILLEQTSNVFYLTELDLNSYINSIYRSYARLISRAKLIRLAFPDQKCINELILPLREDSISTIDYFPISTVP